MKCQMIHGLLSIFPFPVCSIVTMDIDETSVNAVVSLLLAFIKHLLTRHIFYLRFGNSYRLTLVFLPGWQNCCCKHERKRKKVEKKELKRHGQFVFCWEVWGKGRQEKTLFSWISRPGFIFCNAALFTLLSKAKTAKLLEIMNCYKTKKFSFI